jgi:hypothetical protein
VTNARLLAVLAASAVLAGATLAAPPEPTHTGRGRVVMAQAAAPPGNEPVAAVPPPSAPALPLPVATEPSPDERELAALLADLQRYGTLGPDEMRRELQTMTQAVARTRSDALRVRLAVLHTLSRQSPQDDQRALQLLDAVAKANPGTPALKQLAAVLQVQVAERVRAVRDEQAKSEAALQKLEALRAMERSLLRDRVRSGGGGGGAGSGGN